MSDNIDVAVIGAGHLGRWHAQQLAGLGLSSILTIDGQEQGEAPVDRAVQAVGDRAGDGEEPHAGERGADRKVHSVLIGDVEEAVDLEEDRDQKPAATDTEQSRQEADHHAGRKQHAQDGGDDEHAGERAGQTDRNRFVGLLSKKSGEFNS